MNAFDNTAQTNVYPCLLLQEWFHELLGHECHQAARSLAAAVIKCYTGGTLPEGFSFHIGQFFSMSAAEVAQAH